MQPDGGRGGGGRPPAAAPTAIPGARAAAEDPRWAVLVTSASMGDTTSVDLGESLQEGLFATSMRRGATDHGYGSLGHGHGAWLSSSPHPSATRGGGMAAGAPHHRAPTSPYPTSLPPPTLRRQVRWLRRTRRPCGMPACWPAGLHERRTGHQALATASVPLPPCPAAGLFWVWRAVAARSERRAASAASGGGWGGGG